MDVRLRRFHISVPGRISNSWSAGSSALQETEKSLGKGQFDLLNIFHFY